MRVTLLSAMVLIATGSTTSTYLVDNAFPILNFFGLITLVIWMQYVRAAQEKAAAATVEMRKALEAMKKDIDSRTELVLRVTEFLDHASATEADGHR